MIDRDKVIRELKAARLFFEMGSSRADGVVGNLGCKSGMKYIDDALALLKEFAEPDQAKHIVFGTNRKCSNCGKYLFPAGKFCPHCSRAVKWE